MTSSSGSLILSTDGTGEVTLSTEGQASAGITLELNNPNTTVITETPEVISAPAVEDDPVEAAAKEFTQMMPLFINLVKSNKSRKSLVRVLTQLAEFPLGSKKPTLRNQTERNIFSLFQQLSRSKEIVLTDFIKNMKTNKTETKEL